MEEQELSPQLPLTPVPISNPIQKSTHHNHILFYGLTVLLLMIIVGGASYVLILKSHSSANTQRPSIVNTRSFQTWQFTDSNITFSLRTPNGYMNNTSSTSDYQDNPSNPTTVGLLLESPIDSSHIPTIPIASITVVGNNDDQFTIAKCSNNEDCYQRLLDGAIDASNALKYNNEQMNLYPVTTTILGMQVKGVETDIFDHSKAARTQLEVGENWNRYSFAFVTNGHEFGVTLQVYGSLSATNAQKPLIDSILSTLTIVSVASGPTATPTPIIPTITLQNWVTTTNSHTHFSFKSPSDYKCDKDGDTQRCAYQLNSSQNSQNIFPLRSFSLGFTTEDNSSSNNYFSCSNDASALAHMNTQPYQSRPLDPNLFKITQVSTTILGRQVSGVEEGFIKPSVIPGLYKYPMCINGKEFDAIFNISGNIATLNAQKQLVDAILSTLQL